jgi:hypothetical protein
MLIFQLPVLLHHRGVRREVGNCFIHQLFRQIRWEIEANEERRVELHLRGPTSDPIAFSMGARLPRTFAGRRFGLFVASRFRSDTRGSGLSRLSRLLSDSGQAFRKRTLCMRRKRGRDSTNGRFITLEEARRRPRETIIETVRKRCPEKQERT